MSISGSSKIMPYTDSVIKNAYINCVFSSAKIDKSKSLGTTTLNKDLYII